MEELIKKHQALCLALETFQEALENYQDSGLFDFLGDEKKESIVRSLRDSIIKRFEYCFELTWKCLKKYLQTKEQLQLERHSPRYIFKKACEIKLLTPDEAEQALEMLESRNKTSHMYQEEFSDFLAKQTPGYYQLMKAIAAKIAD